MCPESVLCLLQRNDSDLFDLFLKSKDFIFSDEILLNIDFSKAFEITVKNQNEALAIRLFKIIKYLIQKEDKFCINSSGKFRNIYEFNRKFLDKYLEIIFKNSWTNLIQYILDNYMQNRFLVLFKKDFIQYSDFSNKIHPLNEDQEELSEIIVQEEFSIENLEEKNVKNFFTLIKENQSKKILEHKTVESLVNLKWRSLPMVFYNLNLMLYILLVIFYSINIETYKSGNQDYLELVSRWISFALLVYFYLLEILKILKIKNLYKFKFLLETVNFGLSIAALFLNKNSNYTLKSSFYSSTIILTYALLIRRLDKFWKIGYCIDIIGNIVKKALSFGLVVFILILGFLISFRNRSYSMNSSENTIKLFNQTFESGLIRIFTMGVGYLSTDYMGVDFIRENNAINFLVYSSFIFLIPLFIA